MSKALQSYYLQQMGIETWSIRKPVIQQMKLWVIGQGIERNQQAHGLLHKILNSVGILPEEVVLKSGVLEQLIQELKRNAPQLILAMGNEAIHALLNSNQPMMSLRGQVHFFHNTPLIVSYHPMDLLQQPLNKKQAYQDMLFIQRLLAQSSC